MNEYAAGELPGRRNKAPGESKPNSKRPTGFIQFDQGAVDKGDYGDGSDSNSLRAKNHDPHHEQHFRVVELVMVGWYASTGRY